MEFRTEIKLLPAQFNISHRDKILLMGSCFAENIGNKLQSCGFQTDINPFGVLYNPLSVASGLRSLISGRKYTEEDIFEFKGLFSSFSHHSRFSALTAAGCLEKINERMTSSSSFLQKATFLVVTLGTAYVYRLKENGTVVSNCHKLPSAHFSHERLTVSDIVSVWQPLLKDLRISFPHLNILFTVSPIRHWKDGAHENQLSKAALLLAIEALQELSAGYFPSYELMLDDLRDYRFYAEDMLHPSSMAVDYIWEKFGDVYFDRQTKANIQEYCRIRQMLEHRPFQVDSEGYKAFLEDAKKRLENFRNTIF